MTIDDKIIDEKIPSDQSTNHIFDYKFFFAFDLP